MAGSKLKTSHLLVILMTLSLVIWWLNNDDNASAASRTGAPNGVTTHSTLMSFCPWSTSRKHIPTVILRGDGLNHRRTNRTHWVTDPGTFLPWAYPPRDLRIAQHISDKAAAAANEPGRGRLNLDPDERGKQLCPMYTVPSSPPPFVPPSWSDNKVMFGMSTTADRVLYNIPVWQHWIPTAGSALDQTTEEQVKNTPRLLILTPPPNPTEAARTREAVEEARGLGINLVMRKKESDRFETRYFSLAQEMWEESRKRESTEGVKTEWFVFMDDDTFFPDFESFKRMLSQHDYESPVLIGALSESKKQVKQWGHISYGGAGIYVSRGLLALMNEPGKIDECLEKFGSSFGGDAMVSHCAALVTNKQVKDILTIDPTLHQMDIRGDGTGFFQSGFLFTSLHHWGSWFTLFPPWSETGTGDLRKQVTTVGKAAHAVNGDNWQRRYVFENGKVVVNLGYSVVLEAKAVTESELDKSEHTWWEFETFHPIRPGQEEALEKRTYYITGIKHLERDIVRLEHKNREGERVDIIFDAREGKAMPQTSWWRHGSGH
ncbi:hypothetical protein OIO90_006555 [Microbotryomycetes sp. JL221]|nr:hypothetical protein OIO90_006555 [Microbotryomycetes sp. JL221]